MTGAFVEGGRFFKLYLWSTIINNNNIGNI